MHIPLWKVKREIKRLFAQINQIPWLMFSSTIRKTYDKRTERLVRFIKGEQAFGDNVAIFLIFQPKGVERSTFVTLKHLIANGFTPIVVSNARLDEQDIERLKKFTQTIIQRPNFGYDFGGYRQGMMYVLEQKLDLDNILVLNDSIWFPIKPNCEFLAEVKSQNIDLYGMVINNQYKLSKRHHVQSYFFNFKRTVIESEDFSKYWINLFLSNNKNAVIRQCEIKMTDYFRSRGFSIGAKYSVDDIYKVLPSLSPSELERIVEYQATVDPKRKSVINRCLHDLGRAANDYLIQNRFLGKYLLIAHPLVLLKSLQCPAIKKDRQFIYQVQRKEIFETNLDRDLIDIVRDEMIDRDRRADVTGVPTRRSDIHAY